MDICKGLVFKPYETNYMVGKLRKGTLRYEQKRGLRLLRRESCNNCPRCHYTMEQLEIDASELNFMADSLDTSKLYKLVLVDEYSVAFKEIQNANQLR